MQKSKLAVLFSLLTVLFALGCHTDESMMDPDASIDSPIDAMVGWHPLVSRTWSLPTGEKTFCYTEKVTQDLTLKGFRTDQIPGQYRVFLKVMDDVDFKASGNFDCGWGLSYQAQMGIVYGSATGTGEVTFPQGTGVRVKAGQWVGIVVHVVNSTPSTLTGTSTIEALYGLPGEVSRDVRLVFASPKLYDLVLPAHSVNVVTQGGCTVPEKWTVVGLWPQMRALGRQILLTATSGNVGRTLILNNNYDFNHQDYIPLANEEVLNAGDQLMTTCLHDNPTNATVRFQFNDLSTEESCLVGMYLTPPSEKTQLYGCGAW